MYLTYGPPCMRVHYQYLQRLSSSTRLYKLEYIEIKVLEISYKMYGFGKVNTIYSKFEDCTEKIMITLT